ncbi:hypothetical protein O981_24805 [Mycobacterium avium 10-5560]|nr:hypothetical protein N602_21705 [Mycobacterium avium subsp. hominissuis 10-5606]ETB47800.1 hypothetical protein O981_24805 [Mycobacterium avium 10-5560]
MFDIMGPTRAKLADGRDLLFFSLPGTALRRSKTAAPCRPEPPKPLRRADSRSCGSTGPPGSG